MDGFAAAWAANKALSEQMKMPKFVASSYYDPIPDLTNKEVYVVDFSFNDVEAFLEKAKSAKSVTIIDHHIGFYEATKNITFPENVKYLYTPDHSGCVAAWNFFFPDQDPIYNAEGDEIAPGRYVPEVLKYIEDRDLWKRELDGWAEVHAFLKSYGFLQKAEDHIELMEKFQKFDSLVYGHLKHSLGGAISSGSAILRAEDQLIRSIIKRNSKIMRFVEYGPKEYDSQDWEPKKTYEIPICEMPYDLASEAGAILCEGHPFAITYETQWATGRRKFSIRSDKATGIKVQEIAVRMGGNGHEHAAGWEADISEELPWD
jgi:oligoribonuclease NrnB/cAMP/cGMP phosphodiesterase (DHH superfamily)